ncbi:unnamed protein product [Protopolystoma xenopodis]|uniref:Uncharacterized protein n=1 Tax=Protopolystoma xenopodis TaxID=117903 RepID=A0A3S5ACA8_9PLAT|nr:unnamed protein product [Protopolystoma xenopodis]
MPSRHAAQPRVSPGRGFTGWRHRDALVPGPGPARPGSHSVVLSFGRFTLAGMARRQGWMRRRLPRRRLVGMRSPAGLAL